MTEAKFPCATCNKEVQIRDHAIQCELCKSWGHIEKLIEFLKAYMLCCVRCSVMLYGLCAQFVRERALQCRNCKSYIETRVQLMAHQQQMDKLLMDEKERLIEHL